MREASPISSRAAEGIDTLEAYAGPVAGYAEQVYCYDPAADAAGLLPAVDALPVRVGVAVIGTVVVFGLIMVARSMNRRPQH